MEGYLDYTKGFHFILMVLMVERFMKYLLDLLQTLQVYQDFYGQYMVQQELILNQQLFMTIFILIK